MPDKLEKLVRDAISAAQEAGELPSFEVCDLGFERPADTGHGDWTSTVALRSAKLARKAPRAIAEAIVGHIAADESIERV
jgi:arginyl-tRNA synthetase